MSKQSWVIGGASSDIRKFQWVQVTGIIYWQWYNVKAYHTLCWKDGIKWCSTIFINLIPFKEKHKTIALTWSHLASTRLPASKKCSYTEWKYLKHKYRNHRRLPVIHSTGQKYQKITLWKYLPFKDRKAIIVSVTLFSHNSAPDWTRELIKPYKDGERLAVSILKNWEVLDLSFLLVTL